jgi:hypothetical protein
MAGKAEMTDPLCAFSGTSGDLCDDRRTMIDAVPLNPAVADDTARSGSPGHSTASGNSRRLRL